MVKLKKKNVERVLAYLMAVMMVFAFYPLTAHAESYSATFSGTAQPQEVKTLDGKIQEDKSVAGTVTYSFKQSDLMEKIAANLKLVSGIAGTAYTTDGNNNYVDVKVKLPEGFTGTAADSSNGTVLKTKQMSASGNTVTVRVFIVPGPSDRSIKNINETLAAYNNDGKDKVVSFSIDYTGAVSKGKAPSDYVVKMEQGTRTIGYGRWISAGVTLNGSDVNIISGKEEKPKPEDLPTMKAKLPGDLLLNGNTEADKVIDVTPEDSLEFTGSLDISSIKEQMSKIEEQYKKTGADFENIKLTDPKSKFTTKITLPKGFKTHDLFPTERDFNLEGADGVFEITGAEKDNSGVVTLEMELKDPDKIKTYKDLKDAIDKCANELKVNVSGIEIEKNVSNNQELTVKGQLTGDMSATAEFNGKLIKFSFEWEAEQKAGGKDVKATDDKAIQLTLRVKKPEDIHAEAKLKGDILIGTDTEHDAVFETKPGNVHDFTGTLDVSDIKKAMAGYKAQMAANEPGANIKLENVESKFTAVLTIPDGMEYTLPKTAENVQLLSAADTFKVTNVVDNGKSINIEMSLKDGIDTFDKLEKAVNACDDTLKVIVKGVKVSDTTVDNQKLKVSGSIDGYLQAKATLNGNIKNFNLSWSAVQSDEGRDKMATDNDSITFTLNVNKPAVVEQKVTLEGDILIGEETEHDELFPTKPGAKHDFTGALDVKKIKEQMTAIEKQHPNADLNKILLEDVKSEFVAKFTLPEKLDFGTPLTTDNVKLEGADGVFTVSEVKVEGKTVTVKMTLKNGITKYTELAKAIKEDCADKLKVVIPQVTVSENAKDGEIFTVVGDITGGMSALATLDMSPAHSPKIAFNLKWDAKQSPEGKDKIATDDNTIQFSLKTKVDKPNPDEPDNPDKPDNPNKPDPNEPGPNKPDPNTPDNNNPKTGDTASPELYLMILSMAAVAGGLVIARRKENNK